VIPKSGIGGNLALLLDTHILVWFGTGSDRLSSKARKAIEDTDARLIVSSATAWEYCDLHQRGRFPEAADFSLIIDMLEPELADFPADLWPLALALPNIHKDPVDRMLAAQTLAGGWTLVTADEDLQRYPIKTLW
jgi:PIN domain nuclease of toxin-antitoxin system